MTVQILFSEESMAISENNTQVYATISKEDKEILRQLAERYKRSLSQEVAYAISLYLEQERAKSEKPTQN